MNPDQARQVADAILRQHFPCFFQRVFKTLEPGIPYQPNWHYLEIATAFERVRLGHTRRLIVNVPPRSGKSLMATIAFPMFVLGHEPTRRFICVSHTEDLARKFSVDRRTIATSSWYQRAFPAMRLNTARPRDLELITTTRGSCFAAGVGGAILGRGADIIVVDDPIKGVDALSKAERRRVAEFYDNTLLTRLDDKQTGAIVIVMQRLHEEDLVGHVLERDNWEVITLPALATTETIHQLSDDPADIYRRRPGDVLHPARESASILDQVRRAQGSLLFQSQYQQAPVPAGGNVIQRNWLKYYTEEERPEFFERVVVSWDTASTLNEDSDWSVGTVWGSMGLDYYLLDVVRGRMETPDLRRAITRLSRHWNADATVIEDTELGRALHQDLRATGQIPTLLHTPQFDKEARLLAQSARFEAGQVHLPDETSWLGDYVKELLAFPNGGHDDQVDSTSQALWYLTSRNRVAPPLERRNPERRNPVRR